MPYVVRGAGDEVIKTRNFMAVVKQPFAEVGANKACRSGN